MVDHVRQQIREKLEALLTNLSTTGSRVFTDRYHKLTSDDLPGIRFYTEDEATLLMCKTPRYLEHNLPVVIDSFAKKKDGVDNLIDKITLEIETAIAADNTLGGLVQINNITSTSISFTDDQEKPLATAKTTFSIIYYTIDGAPQTAI